ncbi:hypothetical protein [Paracoccus sp. ME4]|uniref:hypothetical protein n=1 Tax=Paracoccus sp. ME4 TaxID=3138066 RepID=UPI00398AD557
MFIRHIRSHLSRDRIGDDERCAGADMISHHVGILDPEHSMNPHRQSFDRCHRRILDTYPQGDVRDEIMSIFTALRARPLSECAMMRISDFVKGDQDEMVRAMGRLIFLAGCPEAVLDTGGLIMEGGRPIRLPAEAVSAALDGRPVTHPLTGQVLRNATARIQPCYDLRPGAFIDKLFAERDLAPGPGRSGVLLLCPDDATAHALAAHAGWALTTDERHDEDPAITRGAILRAMRGGVPVFAAMDALPDGLDFDPELVALHPDFTLDEALGNRARRILDRICTREGLRRESMRGDAELLGMASAFKVDADHDIVSRGGGRWAISRGGGSTLNTDFEWELEPMSSRRDEDYLARNRFTLQEAFAHLDAWLARNKALIPGA